MKLPNILTFIRILTVPVLVTLLLFYYEGNEFTIFLIFMLSAFTDSLDGWIARRYQQVTVFGQLLDPIADKLLVGSIFICLIELNIVPAWMVVIILGREFAVTGFRALASSKGIHISASIWGKIKMNMETYTLALLLLGQNILGKFYIAAEIGLYLVIITAIVSAVEYFAKYGSRVISN